MRRAETVAVVGAGSWGTALAIVLADNGHEVRLWGHKPNQIEEINTGTYVMKNIFLISICQKILLVITSLEDALVRIRNHCSSCTNKSNS